MQINIMNLFDGYVRNYHTFNLSIYHGKHSFSMTEIEYFSRLGSMLGYYPFTEDTCDGTYRPMDLTWWGNHDDDYWHDFVLHLERENFYQKDEETLEKLFAEREVIPTNTIGIINVPHKERIDYLLQIMEKFSKVKNSLLIFKTTSTGKNQIYFDEVYAYHFKDNKLDKEKKATISEVSGTLFMQLES